MFTMTTVLGAIYKHGYKQTEGFQDKSVADIMFVVDCTASMWSELEAIKYTIKDFANTIESYGKQTRLGLIEFRDRQIGQEHTIHSFENSTDSFTQFPELFNTEVDKLQAEGGCGYNSSSLDAILLALRQPFTSDAKKVIILFTDAPPSIPDVEAKSVEQVAQAIRDAGVELYIVNTKKSIFGLSSFWSDNEDEKVYTQLVEGTQGKVFELGFRYNLYNFAEELKSNLRKLMDDLKSEFTWNYELGRDESYSDGRYDCTFPIKIWDCNYSRRLYYIDFCYGLNIKSDYELGREQGYSDGRYDCTSQISDKLLFKSRNYQNGYECGFENGKIIAKALAYIRLDKFYIYVYKSQGYKNYKSLWHTLSNISGSSINSQKTYSNYGEDAMIFVDERRPITIKMFSHSGSGKSSLANLLLFSSLIKSDYELGREQGYSDGRYNCASQISDGWYELLFQYSNYRDGYKDGFEYGKIIAKALAYINFDKFRIHGYNIQSYNGDNQDDLFLYCPRLGTSWIYNCDGIFTILGRATANDIIQYQQKEITAKTKAYIKSLRDKLLPGFDQDIASKVINGEIFNELNNHLGELEELKNSVIKKGVTATSALSQANWYEGEASKHWQLSRKQDPIWTEYRRTYKPCWWGGKKWYTFEIKHVDHHRMVWMNYTKLAATLRNQAVSNINDTETTKVEQKNFEHWCEARIRKRNESSIKFA
ncbi:vWA domain-containing protein [Nostoc sp. ChiQUE01b]|uniref:vWA domain-containing protein n=1 Tax=Nostoc sp. ChiQUE01b TaxID=3075376 RepID=UPI002AD1E635|nr:vWA domain-containing protein [Nostoc sp. ChiQUE01b]MDZ8263739.1 VWA domain-containing protein [Nostoc sp. ChiQUE01b]